MLFKPRGAVLHGNTPVTERLSADTATRQESDSEVAERLQRYVESSERFQESVYKEQAKKKGEKAVA